MEKGKPPNGQFKTRVEDLPMDVLKDLSLHLNPRMVSHGDWKSLAGRMGMKYIEIINYERCSDPTLDVLHKWCSGPGDKTVSTLLGILEQMNRADAIKILQPYEFCEGPVNQSQPSGEEHSRYKENDDDSMQDGILPSCQRPSGLPLDDVYTNGREYGFLLDSKRSDCKLAVPNAASSKGNPSEHSSTAAYALVEEGTSEADSQDEVDETSGFLHGRGSQTNAKISEMSVQTQVPSPSVGHDIPVLPSPGQEASGELSGPSLIAPHDKIALVIGNMKYEKKEFDKLAYTVNDALDIACALEKLGFKVISMVDLTLTEMRTSMLAFCRLLGPGIYAVIYYAGHGYELEGENYLLPVDATSTDPHQAIRAQEFLQEMQICNALMNLMFLDCCRTRSKDSRTPRCSLKRGTRGNTIIAYSCCTQHEAFELPNEKNGIYARHLLKHINRNTRVENILMDVSTAVVDSRSVDQRPTYESDAYLDCRLTAPIYQEPEKATARERCEMWREGNELPHFIESQIGAAMLTLTFSKVFSNLMLIDLFITNNTRRTMEECHFQISISGPLVAETCVTQSDFPPSPEKVKFGSIKISGLQKLYNETVFLSIDIEDKEDKFIKKFDLGRPLISGITGSFHEWIKDRRYETPSGSQTSWV